MTSPPERKQQGEMKPMRFYLALYLAKLCAGLIRLVAKGRGTNLPGELAEPDGLLMPFAEHRRMLFGMLEKCLRYEKPAAYKQIQELANNYHKHWVFVHNALTGEMITDSLTGIEYNVAKLAKTGMANQEIADFLGITVNSVRAHLRHIFNKLGIESRKELTFHVI